jgi:hypothetical protein
LIRFFDSTVGKVKPGFTAKPAPSKCVFVKALTILADYGTFTYPQATGYQLTARDSKRITVWFDDAVKAGKLTKGLWQKRVWIGFFVLSRMAKAWLDHYTKYGAVNWDITIARLLGVVLTASISGRCGDVARTLLYKGAEYMQYRHVELMVTGDREARIENLKAHITVEFSKGLKDCPNMNLEYELHPLNDPKQYYMCPILLLLVHALRHGLVYGTTIQEVLDHAIGSVDSKVVWLFPERPILASFGKRRRIELDTPAPSQQTNDTMKRMGLVANVLTRVSTRALRRGTARDVAHLLAPKKGAGFTTNEVRQSIGHSNKTFNGGTTEIYTGAPTREY